MSERPGMFLKFEIGVSWNPRHPPKNHELKYMSRGMRNRYASIRRPPPVTGGHAGNTNSLNNHETYYYYSGRAQPNQCFYTTQAFSSPSQEPFGATARKALPTPMPRQSSSPITGLPNRRARETVRDAAGKSGLLAPDERSRSRSCHERGRSAPPPGNDRPWDAEPEPMAASALPQRSEHRRTTRESRPEVWKALPATPSEYRLDGPDVTWSPITLPMDLLDEEEAIGERTEGRAPRSDTVWPAITKLSKRAGETDDRERGRVTEMESLASALMTVDNGFEDQWWYQGPRLVNIAGDLISSSVMREYSTHGGTVGWAVADADLSAGISRVDTTRTRRSPSSGIDIVSPLSETASPVPSVIGLRRTLTTRSDELHM